MSACHVSLSQKKEKKTDGNSGQLTQRRNLFGSLWLIFLRRYICHTSKILPLWVKWRYYWRISPTNTCDVGICRNISWDCCKNCYRLLWNCDGCKIILQTKNHNQKTSQNHSFERSAVILCRILYFSKQTKNSSGRVNVCPTCQ